MYELNATIWYFLAAGKRPTVLTIEETATCTFAHCARPMCRVVRRSGENFRFFSRTMYYLLLLFFDLEYFERTLAFVMEHFVCVSELSLFCFERSFGKCNSVLKQRMHKMILIKNYLFCDYRTRFARSEKHFCSIYLIHK